MLVGDVMQKVVTGGLFTTEDAAVEQARVDAGELAITGPIFGPKMSRPQGEPADARRSCCRKPDSIRRALLVIQS